MPGRILRHLTAFSGAVEYGEPKPEEKHIEVAAFLEGPTSFIFFFRLHVFDEARIH